MERLTFVDEDGKVLFGNPDGSSKDIGFTIRELAENEEWQALDNIAQRLANCDQRLKHYEDLEEQGRLLELQVAPGTIVYDIKWWDTKTEKVIVKGKTYYRTVNKHKVSKSIFSLYDYNEFGKTVFRTHGEAKNKLAEMEGKEI